MEAPEQIAAEIREREPVFHRLPPNTTRDDLEPRLVGDFFEIGASGRIYSRERVIETVVDRYARGEDELEHTITEFEVRELSEHVFLATYLLAQPDGPVLRTTRRATLWTNELGRWQVVYHQGTIAEPTPT
ncbi:MAG: hypothetical protein QM648_07360 [Solirubrobacterales bacterium]